MSQRRKIGSLRGQRTRLGKTIEEQLEEASQLIDGDSTNADEVEKLRTKARCSVKILNDLSQKYEDLTIKIAECMEDDDDMEDSLKEDGAASIDVSVGVSKMVCRLEVFLESNQNVPQRRVDRYSEGNGDTSEVGRQLEAMLELERLRVQGERDRRSANSTTDSKIRLPKIDFPKFSGEVTKFPEFWDSFEASIHRSTGLQPVEKLSYLRSKLEGEALRTIEGLQTINGNYDVAVELLRKRYGNTQVLITTHYVQMMDLDSAPNNTVKLRNLHDEFEKHLRCLEALGEDITHRHFISMIMAKLPWQVVTKLEESKDEEESWTVELLRKKLSAHLSAREVADRQCVDQTSTAHQGMPRFHVQRKEPFRKSTAEALFVGNRETTKPSTNPRPPRCIFCTGNHWNDECKKFSTLESRKKAVHGRCFICLSDKHLLRSCHATSKPCWHCKQAGNHHRSLCPKRYTRKSEHAAMASDRPGDNKGSARDEYKTTDDVLLASGEKVLLQTALCTIKSQNRVQSVQTRILLDSGSHRSYISRRLANKLKIHPTETETISVVTFGAEKPKNVETRIAKIVMTVKDGTEKPISVNVVPRISGCISRSPVAFDKSNLLWKDLPLADSMPKENELSSIDCLIGSDYYLEFVSQEKIQVRDGLYLLGSEFGWILTGRTNERSVHPSVTMFVSGFVNQSVSELTYQRTADICLPITPNLEDFWQLETIGIKEPPDISEDEKAYKQFERTVQFADGRYHVTWPWKEEFPELPENYELALGRFRSTYRKLSLSNPLLQQYNQIIKDQESKGIIERVPKEEVNSETSIKHYIPHHPVITPMKATTKVRIVYDASAKTKGSNKSLNECLSRGPVILENLCGLLLRFRLHKIVLLADIEKAFLQIGLQRAERDVTRFFWLKDPTNPRVEDNVEIYRFCRVPFGVISSPFLLGATVKHHLGQSSSILAPNLLRNLYVDNVITGTTTVSEATVFYKEAKKLFSEASMNLRQWSSNSREFLIKLPKKDQVEAAEIKVLGIQWYIDSDELGLSANKRKERQRSNKRSVVQAMSQNFDPLGFFAPVTLKVKLFVQELWEKHKDWDEHVTEKEENCWREMHEELLQIPEVRMTRYIPVNGSTIKRLCCFSDASGKAYAATVFLQFKTEDKWISSLLFTKSRLAAKKRMSIPRLELMAVVIGVRCLKFVENQLDLGTLEKILWTDSKCVLHWLKTKKNLSIFVENRLKEIRSHGDIVYKYVKTTDNPADVATRIQEVKDFGKNKLWWEGPPWLSTDQSEWPSWDFQDISQEDFRICEAECRGPKILFETTVMLACSEWLSSPFGIDLSKYSSLSKLLRVTAWVHRFLRLIKVDYKMPGISETDLKNDGPLTIKEIKQAKTLWERYIQSVHFKDMLKRIQDGKGSLLQKQLGISVDEDGTLRCCGRYQNALSLKESRFPKLLPKESEFTKLVITYCHKALLHAGVAHTLSQVRQDYWIPQGRSAVRRIVHDCMVCRRADGGPFQTPPMPPWPSFRVNKSTPFRYIGLDYFGPLFVKTDAKGLTKVWICLYTCLCIRAIHMELVDDLSGEQFLMSLRRFVARRGAPAQIISDNASQFKLANKVMTKLWSSARICESLLTR